MAVETKSRYLPRKLLGRMAAVLTVVGGLVSQIADIAVGQARLEDAYSTIMSVIAGIVLWFLPWQRWDNRGTHVFMGASLIALFMGDLFDGGNTHPEVVPVLLVTLFAWNGLAHGRWASVIYGIPAFITYIGPGIVDPVNNHGRFGAVLTIPMAVILGETMGWISEKLTTADNERLMNQHRLDFLSAAQHEIKTPLTLIKGNARLLASRGDRLTDVQKADGLDAMVRASDRLQSLVDKLAQVDSPEHDPSNLEALGLLAEHYGGGPIDMTDPLRGGSQQEDRMDK